MSINLVTGFAVLAIAWGALETGSELYGLAQGTSEPLRHVSRVILPLLWLGAGIGLYRRKEAARKLVVGLLALSVVINVILMVYSTYLALWVMRTPPGLADMADVDASLQGGRTTAVAAAAAGLIGVVICGWLFRRFQSADVRREFA